MCIGDSRLSTLLILRTGVMKNKANKLSRVVLMVVTLIILLVPFALYYFFYVTSQQAYFIDRSRRALGSIGDQIASRIDGVRNVVQNASQKDCAPKGKAVDGTQRLFNRNAIRPFGVELEFVRFQSDESPKAKRKDNAQPKPKKPVVTLDFKKAGSKNQIVFNNEQFSVAVATEDLLAPAVDRFVVHDRQTDGEDLFDKVFVADAATGQVLFEYGLDASTIVNLDDFLVAHLSTSEKKSGQSDDKGSAAANSKDVKPNPGRLGRGSTGMSSISIAETDHRLFFQPIELTVPRAGSASGEVPKLIVCGLVRSDHLSRKSFSFSYTLLLLVGLLVLITIVSAPLIKLRLLGPKDRLRKTDAVLTAASAFFGTGLLILLLLDLYTYASLENQLDKQLEKLARSVDSNLRSELVSASNQLDALNQKLDEDLSTADEEFVCASEKEQRDEIIKSDDPTALTRKFFREDILSGNGILDPNNSEYPYFNGAMWADHAGQQQIKFTTKRVHTPFISVEHRQFHKHAKEDDLWDLNVIEQGTKSSHRLYLDALNSRTSGENVAVISRLTPDELYVSAMDMKLLSIYRPVLPTGYGFCVIDSSGLVLFHADDVRNLEENFFDECNNDMRLRAAVQLRQREPVNIQYLGRAHRAFVAPLSDLPWTLVVFREKQILRTINLEIVTLATILFCAYGILLIVALALIFLPFFPNAKKRLENIWPAEEHHAKYNQIAVVNLALFLIFLLLVIVTRRDALVVWALLFPSLVIWHALMLKSGKPMFRISSLEKLSLLADWRRSYSLAMAAMLAVGCVAPTMAFFKLMRDEQIRVFIRHGQMSLARGLELREYQVLNQYDSADPPIDVGQNRELFIQTRLNRDWDVYDSFFFGTTRKKTYGGADQPLSGWLCWFLTRCSPFYNETCVETLALVRTRSADTRWSSAESGEDLILGFHPIGSRANRAFRSGVDQESKGVSAPVNEQTTKPSVDDKTKSRWTLISIAPTFVNFTDPLMWVFALTIGLALVAIYFGVRYCARRIFLLDVWAPRSTPVSIAKAIDKNYMVVRPPLFNSADLFPNGSFLRLDLSSVPLIEWWRFEADLEKAPEDLPVVIDRFEINKDDPVCNQRKLEFVQRLIREKRKVLIISSKDPTAFPLPGEEADSTRSAGKGKQSDNGKPAAAGIVLEPVVVKSPADVQRWALALSSFVRAENLERVEPNGQHALARNLRIAPWPSVVEAPIGGNLDDEQEETIAQIGEQADAYYQGVWSTLSKDEKLTLFRVAQDGLVSRFDPDLRRLMQLGLIVRDPSLGLRDKSFRRFVLSVSSAEGVNMHRADVYSNWDRLKIPLLLVLFAVIAFLFLTQKELYDSTISLVTALTGGAFALLKLFGMFQRGKDPGAAQT